MLYRGFDSTPQSACSGELRETGCGTSAGVELQSNADKTGVAEIRKSGTGL